MRDYSFIKEGGFVYYGGSTEKPKGIYKVIEVILSPDEGFYDISDGTVLCIKNDRGEHFYTFADEVIESDGMN